MIRNALIILLPFLLYGCSLVTDQKKVVSDAYAESSDELVIISMNPSKYPIKVFRNRGFVALAELEEKIIDKVDTFNLKINESEFVYISHRNAQIDTILVSLGDTLRLYPKDNHIVYSINRKNEKDADFLKSYNEYKSTKEIQRINRSVDSLRAVFYKVDKTGTPFVSGDEYTKYISYPLNVNRKAFNENPKALSDLVALLRAQFNSYKDYLSNSGYSLHFVKNVEYLEQYRLFNELSLLKNISNHESILKTINSNLFLNDDLQYSPFAKSIIGYVLTANLVEKETDFSANKTYWNWKPANDNASDLMSDSLAKYARLLSIERMIDFGEPIDDVKKKFEDFRIYYKDEAINQYLAKKYIFDLDSLKKIEKDVVLITSNRQSYSLDALLKKYSGKLVYVDFWASWCGPCRQAMPTSRALLRRYSKEEIVFVYLSIDQDMDKWKKAASAEGIDTYTNSYLVLNWEASQFLKRIKLSEIPRYLLFDKSGKLLHQEAPGPESQAVHKLFDQSL